jgi:hypothetical protein
MDCHTTSYLAITALWEASLNRNVNHTAHFRLILLVIAWRDKVSTWQSSGGSAILTHRLGIPKTILTGSPRHFVTRNDKSVGIATLCTGSQ